MSKLNLIRVSDLKTEKVRKDDKVSRQYFTIYVVDAANPFTSGAQRNIYQNHSADGKTAFWKTIDFKGAKALVGQSLEGEVSRLEVKPYDIDGRMASSYTCLILKGEDPATIARQSGHEMVFSAPVATEVEKEQA